MAYVVWLAASQWDNWIDNGKRFTTRKDAEAHAQWLSNTYPNNVYKTEIRTDGH